MLIKNVAVADPAHARYQNDLPQVVKNDPKKCRALEGRVESEWKVSSPSLELTAPSCPKISRAFFQNPPIDFPL